ncbi:MAG TPA: amidohydrolase family protein [Vicinamibacterales bacterium]|nr:amidohydrolase family protein [Vicinamibacterales bacterium]
MLDLALYNGTVLTQATPARATAVGVCDRRIVVVGDDRTVLSAAGPATRRIDLAGRCLTPGFNDAHAHIWKIGHLLTTMLDLRRVGSLGELVARVADFGARLPDGAWLLGRGFNEAAFPERRAPTRDDLDRAAPARPAVLTRTCGHIYAANSAALNQAGIGVDTDAPAGGVIERDERGRPTGLLHETAMGLINRSMPPPTAGDLEAMIAAGLRHQLSLGITSSADCGVAPSLLDVYRAVDARRALPARINVMPLRRVDGVARPVPLPERFVSDQLRVDTAKFLADGGLSGATAALSVAYRHEPRAGVLRFDDEELRALCRETHDAGWRIATHAIGDVAIDQILGIYESLGPHPLGLAHRIEHFGLPDSTQLGRAASLGVIAAPQTIFIHSLGRNFRAYLPDSFLPRTYPVRAMLDAGVRVALSSDAPVVDDDNPLAGMRAAITRRDADGQLIAPDQAISAREALFAYTMGGAIASGDADNRGSIEPGKWADLAVLTGNPLEQDADALTDLTVDLTMLGGRIVYEA